MWGRIRKNLQLLTSSLVCYAVYTMGPGQGAILRCTACGLTFSSTIEHRAHYQAEFHRYNLKRRTNGLGPVTEADFLRRRSAAHSLAAAEKSGGGAGFHARCTACNRSFSSQPTLQQHLQSKKHAQMVKKAAEGDQHQVAEEDEEEEPMSEEEVGEEEEEEERGSHHVITNPMQAVASNSSGKVARPPSEEDLAPATCIFCNTRHSSVEENRRHMHRDHGFFIPDAEYLVDLPGLLRYCNEKVKVGCMCLYCNGKGKAFRLYGDVQKHMDSKCHCKLRYEEGEDLHEFRAFYDFSSSYQDQQQVRPAAITIVDSDGEEWEAVTEGGDEHDEGARPAVLEELFVTELGELQLADGRLVGCREFARYYKQRYRAEDTRECVLASRAESNRRLLLASAAARGGGAATTAGGGLVRLGSKEVMMKAALMRQVRTMQGNRLRVELNTNRFHKRPQIDG